MSATVCKTCGHAYYGSIPVQCVDCHGTQFGADVSKSVPVLEPIPSMDEPPPTVVVSEAQEEPKDL